MDLQQKGNNLPRVWPRSSRGEQTTTTAPDTLGACRSLWLLLPRRVKDPDG